MKRIKQIYKTFTTEMYNNKQINKKKKENIEKDFLECVIIIIRLLECYQYPEVKGRGSVRDIQMRGIVSPTALV